MNTIYPIRLYGDPVLRSQTRVVPATQTRFTVPGFDPVDRQTLARNLLESMYEARGVGLAAPQVGLPIRLVVAAEYDDDQPEGEAQPLKARALREFVMFNPVLEIIDDRLEARYADGCLSIPEVYKEGVRRPRAVRVRYEDEGGAPHTVEADDYLARVFHHEYDHLFGRLYLDLLPRAVTEKHREYLVALQRRAKAYIKALPVKDKQRRY